MRTDTNIIGIKELIKNLKTIYREVDRGNEFIVVKNSKPAFRIIPVDKKEKSREKVDNTDLVKKLEKIQFSGNENLSQNIDKIIYNLWAELSSIRMSGFLF